MVDEPISGCQNVEIKASVRHYVLKEDSTTLVLMGFSNVCISDSRYTTTIDEQKQHFNLPTRQAKIVLNSQNFTYAA